MKYIAAITTITDRIMYCPVKSIGIFIEPRNPSIPIIPTIQQTTVVFVTNYLFTSLK